MKKKGCKISKGEGSMTLEAQNDEDIWHAYNLINIGDEVRSSAVRKIVSESNSTSGNKESRRVHLNLTIEVKKIAYSGVDLDGADGSEGGSSVNPNKPPPDTAILHLSGPISQPNEHVKMGAFHTLDIEAGRTFTITKGPHGWGSLHFERIKESQDGATGADVGAVLCDESGKASICLIGSHTTTVRQRIEVNLTQKKKTGQGSGNEKAMDKYHRQIYDGIIKYFPLTDLKLIIFASPGGAKDSAYEWVFAEALRTGNKAMITSKSKVKRLPISSAHVKSLTEVLSSPQIANQLQGTKYTKEIQALEKFDKLLVSDEQKACYGERHVEKAADFGAIGTLMISDALFRNSDPIKRKKFMELSKQVEQFGGSVMVFSSMNASSTRLSELTGVAAILTFPLDMDAI
ncbi:eRF1 domain 1-domain-containing protein [Melampsora americana]|nr:eRF1 domain 1-domain-containing protein [Melampsora americana]